MAINNVINQDENGNKFERAKEIEINRSIVKFGTSVYQFKNVTGFEVGIIPKNKFPVLLFSILLAVSSLMLTAASSIYSILPKEYLFKTPEFSMFVLISCVPFCLAVYLIIIENNQLIKYGLTIYLNSGQKSVFVSEDKSFLMDIVDSLYSFMKEEQAKSLLIDMSNRSITVGGSIGGSATAGDKNRI